MQMRPDCAIKGEIVIKKTPINIAHRLLRCGRGPVKCLAQGFRMANGALALRIICLRGFEFGLAEELQERLCGGVEAFLFAVNDPQGAIKL